MIARKQSHAILGYYKVSCELLKRMSTNNLAKRSFIVCMKGRESSDGLEKSRRKYLRLRAVDDVQARYMEEAERDDLDDSCRGVDVWVMERSACASEEVLKGYEKVRFWSSCFVLFCSVCLARARERERERERALCVLSPVCFDFSLRDIDLTRIIVYSCY